MEFLAAHGLIHRDLAPRNVMLAHFDPADPSATSVKVAGNSPEGLDRPASRGHGCGHPS
jgi:hypothetical protein